MSGYKARLSSIDHILNADIIHLLKLKELSLGGIPDEGGRRALSWKLLLGYLPLQRTKWKDVLDQKRCQYQNFIREMVVDPSLLSKSKSSPEVEDHPLNPSPDSQWRSFFDDNQILAQIDKDVRRLCPDMMFFQRGTDYPCLLVVGEEGVERLHRRVTTETLSAAAVTRKGLGINKIEASRKSVATEDYKPLPPGSEAHWEVVERILFIYAKLNPGQSYVQGMNEIIGPLYYTFATDPDLGMRQHAEADTFFCFISLMAQARDLFIRTLDKSSSGIGAMMDRLMKNLKHHDTQLFNHLQSQELKPQYYSFRWLTLLLSQEFDMPDLIQVWDTLFADNGGFGYLIQICTAMIVLQRDTILASDFANNVKLLQRYPPIDVRIIIQKGLSLPEQEFT
ncbi:UNVERIFIED_CONTAM: hypothetical protein RMT77_011744 [Armadillidium vulgare]